MLTPDCMTSSPDLHVGMLLSSGDPAEFEHRRVAALGSRILVVVV